MTAHVLISVRVAVGQARAFAAFTDDIAAWWVPDPLFPIKQAGDGVLAFEKGAGGRLVSRAADGTEFEIGRIRAWDPPRRLAFSWRSDAFGDAMETEVLVTFEPVENGTRVTVTHAGWLGIPRRHVARHGFPDEVTQLRAGEWWRRSLERLKARLS